MKYFISLVASLILLTGIAAAQQLKEDSVPAVVKKTCKEKFPSVNKIEWKLKSDKNYEAEFTQNGAELAVKFSSDGKWLETESEIKDSQVPAAVKNSIAKDFPGYKVIELQSVEAVGAKELAYEIHVKKEKEVVKVQYSPDGKQLNKSSKMEK